MTWGEVLFLCACGVMVFLPERVWRIFYGNFSPGGAPGWRLLLAYRCAGGVAFAGWAWVRLTGFGG